MGNITRFRVKEIKDDAVCNMDVVMAFYGEPAN